MDTEPTVEQQLLKHAERQTSAIERIDRIVFASFLIGLAATAIWVIVFFAS